MFLDQQQITNNQQPTTNNLFTACGPFEPSPHLAVAVSGGADSMALLLLAHEWATAQGGRVTALTVDHGLRTESATEAAQVAQWCAARGIDHHILPWQPTGTTQEAARTARYRLLAGWCRAHHVLHLLTAHHRNDQAETLLFRLGRGSAIDGLAGMPLVSSVHGIRLLRPLLPVPKAELVAFLEQIGQPWVEDPSNINPRYARSRIRAHAPDTAQAADLARRLGHVRHTLESTLAVQLACTVTLFAEGYAAIDREAFSQLPPDLGVRALARLIATVGGGEHPPRTAKLERFHAGMGTDQRRTLGGCLFIPRKTHILACREPNALAPGMVLAPGAAQHWDRRFEVAHTADTPMTVRPLGGAWAENRPKWLEKAVFSALPSFWHLEELIAVPHMGYTHPDYRGAVCRARFRPVKPLAGQAFLKCAY